MTTRKPKPAQPRRRAPGGGRPRSEAEPLDANLLARVTASEQTAARDAAAREGLSLSAWARRAVRAALGL